MGVVGVVRSVDRLDRVAGSIGAVPTDEHAIVRGLWRAVDVFRVPGARLRRMVRCGCARDEVAHLVRRGRRSSRCSPAGPWPRRFDRVRTVRAYAIELVLGCAAILATRLVDHAWVITGGRQDDSRRSGPRPPIVGWAMLRGWRGGVARRLRSSPPCSFLEVVQPTAQHRHELDLRAAPRRVHRLLRRPGPRQPRDAGRGDASRRRPRRARPPGPHRPRRRPPDARLHPPPRPATSAVSRHVSAPWPASRSGSCARWSARPTSTRWAAPSAATRTCACCCATSRATSSISSSPPNRSSCRGGSADEVVAAVEAALDNVRKHAGDDARGVGAGRRRRRRGRR